VNKNDFYPIEYTSPAVGQLAGDITDSLLANPKFVRGAAIIMTLLTICVIGSIALILYKFIYATRLSSDHENAGLRLHHLQER
jgi:hypothetical protein